MSLRLRKVTDHPRAEDAYRIVFTADDGREYQVGSIGLQTSARQRVYWHWGIDTVLPRQAFATAGEASDRDDAMKQFRAVWKPMMVIHMSALHERRRRTSRPEPGATSQAPFPIERSRAAIVTMDTAIVEIAEVLRIGMDQRRDLVLEAGIADRGRDAVELVERKACQHHEVGLIPS